MMIYRTLVELLEQEEEYQFAVERGEEDLARQIEKRVTELYETLLEDIDSIPEATSHLKKLQESNKELSKRYADKAKKIEKSLERLKGLVISVVTMAGGELKTAHHKFRTYEKDSIDIKEPEKVPEEFIEYKPEIRKSLIMKHIKETGVIPDGVEIITKTHLRVL